MKTNKTINELKAIDKNVFKALNQSFGYNFEADFTIEKIDGAFTINKIINTVKVDPVNNEISVIIISGNKYRENDLNVVEISGKGINDFNIDTAKKWFSFKTKFSHFYSKGCFNDERKTAKGCYIISQNKELLSGIYKEKEIDTSGRLTEKEIDTLTGWKYRNAYSKTDFDKSGYCISKKRFKLGREARLLRAEREKAAFQQTNNAEKIKELSAMLTGLKQTIISKLQEASTPEQIKVIEKSLSWYKGLADCLERFNRIEKGEKEKTFSSIESFNKAITDLTDTIKLIEKEVA